MFLNRQSAEISLNCPTNFAPSQQSRYNIETHSCYYIETQQLIPLQYWNTATNPATILKHSQQSCYKIKTQPAVLQNIETQPPILLQYWNTASNSSKYLNGSHLSYSTGWVATILEHRQCCSITVSNSSKYSEAGCQNLWLNLKKNCWSKTLSKILHKKWNTTFVIH